MSTLSAQSPSIDSTRGWTRAVLAGAAAAILLLVVALGTRGGGAVNVPAAPIAVWRLTVGVVAGIVGGIALAGFALVVESMYGGWGKENTELPRWRIGPPPTHWAYKVVFLVLPLGVAAGAAAGVVLLTSGIRSTPSASPSRAGTPGQVASPPVPSAVSGSSQLPTWALGAGAMGALGVAMAVLGTASRRRRGIEELALGESRVDSVAVTRAIAILTDEEDPRRAVIAAYAAMEQLLATAGAARRPAEAPFEYVARNPILLGAGRSAAHRLSELFEAARFSLHTVDESTRRQALAALRTIQAELSA